ncbi:MAG: ComF family protein [Peptococcaceae bacterium]
MICSSCRTILQDYKERLTQCTRCGTFGKPGRVCDNCREWPGYLKKNFTAVPYEKQYRHALHLLKFKKQGWLTPVFVELMTEELPVSAIDLIIPVPLHHNRLKERGFNQAALMAKEAARKLELAYDDKVLYRIMDTPHQTGLTKSQRQRNLTNAFSVPDVAKVRSRTVLLVDDVITSGTTIRECAKTLRKAGAKAVYSATFAAGIR